MKLVKIDDFDQAYSLLEKCFPSSELRLYDRMKELYNNQEFKLYGYIDHDIIAIINPWEFNNFIYIEYLCINAKYRSKGLGTRILQEIQSVYKDKLIVLEVEEPISAIELKRIKFYQNNHFILNNYHYIQPPFRKGEKDVVLYMMSYPISLNNELFNDIKDILFKEVYKVRV